MQRRNLFCIGFIIYHPEPSLVSRIEMCLKEGYKCYVFDNTPDQSVIRNKFKNSENFYYCTPGKNLGLGVGMSMINSMAYYDGFQNLLFFDQDTGFSIETLNFVEKFIKSSHYDPSKYSSVVFNSKNSETKQKFVIREVFLSISSGSLFLLKNLKKIGFHNESFFVDCVDYEFCLNSYNHHFKTLECSNTEGFDHVTEQADKPYSFFGKTLMLRVYPIKRVIGTIFGYFKLIIITLKTFNFKYFYLISRSATIYLMFQILVRILTIFKK